MSAIVVCLQNDLYFEVDITLTVCFWKLFHLDRAIVN